MNEQEYNNYCRIAEVIELAQQDCMKQPKLEEIAKKIGLNSADFQKLFNDWAGVEPAKFLEYINVQYAKQILSNSQSKLFETSSKTEPLGNARLHNQLVEIVEMTPEEYQNDCKNLDINYSFTKSLFGLLLVASTHKGICYLGFSDNKQIAFSDLQKRFSKAKFIQQADNIQQNALQIFTTDRSKINKIKLHLKGSYFQLSVWKALLQIPMGSLLSYKDIAEIIQKPKSARAVGTAIGSNPISFIIPCHRVIQSSGAYGGYMWGTIRKTAIIGWEAAKVNSLDID
ncbi:MAG: methylated-DNA--[protein]-cysteine S-methyltransferase [Bacteroidales bacterium]|nr:methylated-DNA--[protein]-cysteine S-methyltransferase [Bacteroidales bacterium]